MKRSVVGATVGAVGAGALFERYARNQTAVSDGGDIDVDGSRLRVYESGDGPGVVIVNGAGDCFASWSAVLHRLRGVHAVGYDRPGMGLSPPGPAPTTARYLAQLDAVVRVAGGASVVLVGHSLGGLLARLYTRLHPELVGALVLVDATPEAVANDSGVKTGFAISSGLATALKTLSPLGVPRLMLRAKAMPLYPEARQFRADITPDEFARWETAVCQSIAGNTGPELRSVLKVVVDATESADTRSPELGDLPLTVLASNAFGEKWIDWQRALTTLSTNAEFDATAMRSHNIHQRHPELLAELIERAATASARAPA